MMVSVAPTAIEVGGVPTIEKRPVGPGAMLVIGSGAVPVFWSVSGNIAGPASTSTPPKARAIAGPTVRPGPLEL
jgi:hypothetical protein